MSASMEFLKSAKEDTMRNNTCLIVLTFVALLLGAAPALAVDCGELERVGSDCMSTVRIPWVAFGGDWQARLRLANIKTDSTKPTGLVRACGFPVTPNGVSGLYFFSDNRPGEAPRNYSAGSCQLYNLQPGGSVEMTYLHPATCANPCVTPQPEPSQTATGSLVLYYIASDPEYLRDLVPAQVAFLSRDQVGGFTFHATETQVTPARKWVFPISETANKADSWRDRQDTSFAVTRVRKNPPPTTLRLQNVQVTLRDQQGQQVAAKSFYLDIGGPGAVTTGPTYGVTFESFFGNAMFPGGKDFTGTATIEVLSPDDDPLIIVAAFMRIGASMGGITPIAIK